MWTDVAPPPCTHNLQSRTPRTHARTHARTKKRVRAIGISIGIGIGITIGTGTRGTPHAQYEASSAGRTPRHQQPPTERVH